MTALRAELAQQLARKVNAHGLVVWDDPTGEYRSMAASVIPPDTRFEPFEGSWYQLRRRVDPAIAGDSPPRMVVYTPIAAPDEDPLAEIRDMAGPFKVRLATLIRQALSGQITQDRIDTIARTSTTLETAENALTGESTADARLIAALGSSETATMLTTLLSGSRDQTIIEAGLDDAVREMCRATTGVDPGSGPQRAERLFTGLLLNDLCLALGGSPQGLASACPQATAAQKQTSRRVLHMLSVMVSLDVYRRIAQAADRDLDLPQSIGWDERLTEIPGTPGLEEVAFAAAIAMVLADDDTGAGALAHARLTTSPWARDTTATWRARWTLIRHLVDLRTALSRTPPASGSADAQLRWYAEHGWTVDRAHRRLELARTEVATLGPVDGLLTAAREAYDTWLDALLRSFTAAVADTGLETAGLLRQVQIHDRFIGALPSEGLRTAYIWVDALRFELARDLVDSLASLDATVTLEAAVAAAPTITPVGMAALLPGAEESLQVALDGDAIRARLGGQLVTTVPHRVERLKVRHGAVLDLDLNDAANQSEQRLHRSVENSAVVLVRSQELDAAGESGMLAAAWSTFSAVITLLRTVVSRLADAGVERIVITADHGFLALSQGLGPQRVVDLPAGASGAGKRRCFVGIGGAPSPATTTVPLPACGVSSDLDITVPNGLAVFRAGGDRQFFHGGLSPQELLVPVLVVEMRQRPTPSQGRVKVTVAGERITTGIFSISIEFTGTLFADQVVVRAVATNDRRPIARVVSGDGVDADSDVVTVTHERTSILTFQVTSNLQAGESICIAVLDAATGRTLAGHDVPVAATIVVEDSLD